MATAQPPVVDSLHQAGGGVSETQQTIKSLSTNVTRSLKKVFDSQAGASGKWSSDQVKDFIHKVQDHHDDASAAADLLLKQEEVDLYGFLGFMSSGVNAITLPRKDEDLSWPLASYFISSSHNTYLTGNQLSSDSTTGAYTNVLQRGCRCVEVDVWDGDESDAESDSSDVEAGKEGRKSKDKAKKSSWSKYDQLKSKLPGSVTSKMEKTSLGKKIEAKATDKLGPAAERASHAGEPEVAVIEPRVLHGYTLTKDISFRDVCVAIRKSAFAVTDLPLIVSLEVHCGADQQQVMVDIINQTWKDVLVPAPETDAAQLPSLDQLKGKILVKVKYAAPGSAAEKAEIGSGDDDRLPADTAGQSKKTPPPKIIQALSRLGIYTKAITFKALTQPEASMPDHIFSLSENKFMDHHEKQWAGLFNHNRNFLMRTYPSGLRIGSSNLNPAVFWGGGAQVVALNWQQTDEGMMLNEGMFAGTRGYVLKPEGYRPDLGSKTSPNKIIYKTLNLTLTFLAAQSIPLPPDEKSAKGFKPYVKVELHVDASERHHKGDDGHEREGEYKARTQTHRGCDLDLQSEKLEFRNIPRLIEELTFVRFTVRDDEFGRDDLAAWACVRLDRLGQGYRFVHLMNSNGALTDGAILVKIEKTLT